MPSPRQHPSPIPDPRECLVADRLHYLRLWAEQGEERTLADRRLAGRLRRSHGIWKSRRDRLPRVSYPPELPITARREEIVALIREHPVVVVAGETGSGKTTQIPKMCLEAGLGVAGKIACTQPRRVAALSVSQRVAQELDVVWGREVGCKIRFSDQTYPGTLIKMMTDGVLLAEIQGDPDLTEYEVILIDEAHERSLNIDFLLGHLRRLRERRPDLKVIVTSATIDPETFSRAFGGAPVVEVSGRTYPVETEYRPLDAFLEEEGELTYIEAAAAAVEEIVSGRSGGDILVFMPGERDIRETRDLIEDRRLPGCEILPLFGRLSGGDQQRIFQSSNRRKIIIATNIAETSLTIPGIRYVIDTGLARISRFSPQTRTQRLPVEPISRSSADQRKGRCGRVADGVCVRLYAEEDYEARSRFTPPEILRSNLASVILRMKAFQLGEVERFPFIDPPHDKAIKAGYTLLQDLGALDRKRELTDLGHRLARLPVDPVIGRMLLESLRENALREVLVIASGLSVQDPRERPVEARAAADEMHRRFLNRESDFLTLFNIWEAYHDETERLSQGRLRKFCKTHFLSYTRLREWRDLHRQLVEVLIDLKQYRPNKTPADCAAIHRSILSGLLGNVAKRDEGNRFLATHYRKAMVFPGSGLFDREAARFAKVGGAKKKAQQEKPRNKGPEWIMAGEWFQTGRLYARTCARIEPDWLPALGAHLCKAVVSEPRWEAKSGQVLAGERMFLYGLEVRRRRVGYERHQREDAVEIFVRDGLVADEVRERFGFLEHNRKLCREFQERRTRLRQSAGWAMEERLYAFYRERIGDAACVAELRRLIRDRGNDDFLRLGENDLPDGGGKTFDSGAFPAEVRLGERAVSLEYNYTPGEERDGVTLNVPIEEVSALRPGMLDWLVPGYLEERIDCLLRGLPKTTRKRLFPIGDKVGELLDVLKPSARPLTEVLSEEIASRYGVRIGRGEWPEENVPEYLKPRIEVKDTGNRTLASGRDWDRVVERCDRRRESAARDGSGADALPGWREAAARWECSGVTGWTFGDVPESLRAGEIAGVPVEAFPGLCRENDGTAGLRLFRSRAEAEASSREGLLALCVRVAGKDLAWLRRDLKALRELGPDYATLHPASPIEEAAYANLLRHLYLRDPVLPLKRERFEALLARAREEMRGLPARLADTLEDILKRRRELLTGKAAEQAWVPKAVSGLVALDILEAVPYARLVHLPRYLRAVQVRLERARINPVKDEEKQARVRPFAEALERLEREAGAKGYDRCELEELRWLIEEFKVSVFAQELGTPVKVSAKKLEERIHSIETR